MAGREARGGLDFATAAGACLTTLSGNCSRHMPAPVWHGLDLVEHVPAADPRCAPVARVRMQDDPPTGPAYGVGDQHPLGQQVVGDMDLRDPSARHVPVAYRAMCSTNPDVVRCSHSPRTPPIGGLSSRTPSSGCSPPVASPRPASRAVLLNAKSKVAELLVAGVEGRGGGDLLGSRVVAVVGELGDDGPGLVRRSPRGSARPGRETRGSPPARGPPERGGRGHGAARTAPAPFPSGRGATGA